MKDAVIRVPRPENEPVLSHAPGTPERAALEKMLAIVPKEDVAIPVVAGGERIFTDDTLAVTNPCSHEERLATVHQARAEDVKRAIDGALAAAPAWRRMPFHDRAAIFLKAADLLAGKWRSRINAAAMLGQAKTVYQSEIDAVCELADFWRYNVSFAEQIYADQPRSVPGMWNQADYRPLEGFVLAISPFNFLSIALNLPTAPAIMGNVVLWKPATQTALGAWHCLELLREAGLPEGVISFLPGDGPVQGTAALESEHLAGIHFTGSTKTFRSLWRGVSDRLDRYRSFPRIVGETGGKDFIVAHPSADFDALAVAILRGGFEYQGQKCSAVSRVYVPKSAWGRLRERLASEIAGIKVGDVRDLSNFMGAVIDAHAFEKITGYIALAKETATVVAGGKSDPSRGWYVWPTLAEVSDPKHRLMQEEIFGPVVTAYAYDDAKFDEVLDLVDATSPYGLTGAMFARDREVIVRASERLRFSAGNFYINDKPTGAVVGQQPFGGARASGTDDKAGSLWNLVRWTAPRAIKETFAPPHDYRYPFMGES
jgi:1-pyrroline-5-carboxylate dehydrogenase